MTVSSPSTLLSVTKMKEALTAKQGEVEREVRKKQNLERDLKTMKLDLETKKTESDDKLASAIALQEEVFFLHALQYSQ